MIEILPTKELSEERAKAIANFYKGILTFEATEVLSVMLRLKHRTVVVFAGNQAGKCQTYRTLIDTTEGRIPIGNLFDAGKPFEVLAWDGEHIVSAAAKAPIRKIGEPCIRMVMSDGQWCEPALGHRILSGDDYSLVSDALLSSFSRHILSSDEDHPPSILGHALLAHAEDDLNFFGTTLSSQLRCSLGYHRCDGQLLSGPGIVRAFLPLAIYGMRHDSLLCETDDLWNRYTGILRNILAHLSNPDVSGPRVAQIAESLCRVYGTCDEAYLRSHPGSLPRFLELVFDLLSDVSAYHGQSQSSLAFSYPFMCNGNRVISYTPVGCNVVYDFEVEKYHNYISAGMVHHNTSSVAYQYVLRVFGVHPVPEKNRLARKIRCMSSSLPESASEEEQDNTQYLELKKRIPPEMIKKDITARSQNLVVRRPVGMSSQDTVFEFRSSKQELQDLGKIQLSSVWHDEETPKLQREECKYRLLAENGDEYFTVTLTNPLSYVFDELWQRKGYVFRTSTICEKFGVKAAEYVPGGNKEIAAIQMATDDNPTLTTEAIERLFEEDDEATLLLRRYGQPAHVTGRIHKTYNPGVCYIDHNRYFPNGIPYRWIHARGIDYHESRTPWSVIWLAASPEDEWFAWQEFHPAIDGVNAYNTYEIAKAIARKSEDLIYMLNIIDPLANKKQPNSGLSTVDDLNRHFDDIRKNDGIGTDTYWKGWDTKGTGGRAEIAKRFKNASRVGRPFNNAMKDKGRTVHLPTLWITTECPKTHKSIMNWRYGEYVAQATRMVNDPKTSPQQRFSHDCMTLEAFSKEACLVNAPYLMAHPPAQVHRSGLSVTGR